MKFSKISKSICDTGCQHVFLLNSFTNILWNICNHKFSKCDIPSNINTLKFLRQTFRNIIGQDLSNAFNEATRDFNSNKTDENILRQKLYAINDYQKKLQKDEYEDDDIDELLSIDAETLVSKGEELTLANIDYKNEVKMHNITKKENNILKDDNRILSEEIVNINLEKEKIKKELEIEKEKNRILEEDRFKNRIKKLCTLSITFVKSHIKLCIFIVLSIVLIILIVTKKINFDTIIGLIFAMFTGVF